VQIKNKRFWEVLIACWGKERESGGDISSHYIWGGGVKDIISPVFKVPRQCPLVLIPNMNTVPFRQALRTADCTGYRYNT
jgi:hypothetical protein